MLVVFVAPTRCKQLEKSYLILFNSLGSYKVLRNKLPPALRSRSRLNLN